MSTLRTVLLLALVGCVCSQQIFPIPVCAFFRSAFLFRGCIDDETPFECRLLAFILLFEVSGTPLCASYPCAGYGQLPTRDCRGFFQCSIFNQEPFGICNGFDVCCANSTTTTSAPLLSQEEAMKILDGPISAED